jgi:hypothetical protein
MSSSFFFIPKCVSDASRDPLASHVVHVTDDVPIASPANRVSPVQQIRDLSRLISNMATPMVTPTPRAAPPWSPLFSSLPSLSLRCGREVPTREVGYQARAATRGWGEAIRGSKCCAPASCKVQATFTFVLTPSTHFTNNHSAQAD